MKFDAHAKVTAAIPATTATFATCRTIAERFVADVADVAVGRSENSQPPPTTGTAKCARTGGQVSTTARVQMSDGTTTPRTAGSSAASAALGGNEERRWHLFRLNSQM